MRTWVLDHNPLLAIKIVTCVGVVIG